MAILLYIILAAIVILTYKLLKTFNKNIIITILCSILIIQIVLTPKLCMDAALVGLNLFINKVFPSLFPFLVITSLMISYDGVHIYSKIFGGILCRPIRLPLQCTFALVISILCGYPLGAKYACALYEQGHIDIKTCQRLISIATNTSPLFAIGSVGSAMLKSSHIGYFLLIINYLSCFIMGLLLPSINMKYNKIFTRSELKENRNIGNIIKDSIENSIKTCLSIGGFVVIYSVIISIIKSNIIFDIAVNKLNSFTGLESNLLEGSILGLFEMTNGCYLIANTNVDIYIKVIIISFFLAFSGFSIISQVHSFTYKHNLSMKIYILRKFMQGVIAAISAAILFKVHLNNVPINVFNDFTEPGNDLLLIGIVILLISPYFFAKIKQLLHTP